MQRLWEDPGAENEGIRVPSAARWLRGSATRTRFDEGRLTRSSVVLAVAGETAARHLCQRGARLAGIRYEVEAFGEARPGASCRRCCAWGHIAPQCPAEVPRCALCREAHQTSDHRRPVEACQPRRGCACTHVVARCRNCAGPHLSQTNVCPVKREVRQSAKGWRSPSPLRRERKAAAPPEEKTTESPVTEEGGREVERQPEAEVGREEMEE